MPRGLILQPIDAGGPDVPSPEVVARTRAVLSEYDAAFQLVARARALPAHPWTVESPEWSSMNFLRLQQLLSFRTQALSRLGDSDAAAASLLDEADLLRVEAAHRPTAAPMPFFGSSHQIVAVVAGDLTKVLPRGRLPQSTLEPLATVFAIDPPDELRPMLSWQIQRILRYPSIRDWPARTDGPIPWLAERAALPAEHARDSELLQDRLEALDALGGPELDWPARLTRAESASAQAPHRSLSMLRAIGDMTTGAATAVATVRIARVAVAVERYRQRRGEVPARLADLSPDELDAVPTDPFDGQPLRYRVDEGAVAIYSVGRNLVDDGGRFDVSGMQGWRAAQVPPDIGVRIPIR